MALTYRRQAIELSLEEEDKILTGRLFYRVGISLMVLGVLLTYGSLISSSLLSTLSTSDVRMFVTSGIAIAVAGNIVAVRGVVLRKKDKGEHIRQLHNWSKACAFIAGISTLPLVIYAAMS